MSAILYAVNHASGIVIDPEWQKKAEQYTLAKRLELMQQLWVEDFKHSMHEFEWRFRLQSREKVAEWLRAKAEKQEAPESNWLYQIGADGTLHKNPNWRADR